MKGKSRMECMVKCGLVILHVFQGCLEFIYLNARAQGKKFILRHIIVYSRNESKNIVTLAPWLQFKTWYNAYIAQVYCKEIKSVPRGLLEHTLCKCRCSVPTVLMLATFNLSEKTIERIFLEFSVYFEKFIIAPKMSFSEHHWLTYCTV